MARTTDVCIVGGGFAGLSTAYYLQKQNIATLTLERNATLASKTRTLYSDGHPVELGTCFTSFDYDRVFRLAEDLGVRREQMGRRTSAAEYSIVSDFYSSKRKAALFFARNILGIRKYLREWNRLVARFNENDRKIAETLSVPLNDWLGANGLQGLQPMFSVLGDSYGYGPIDTVPAIYPMRFVSPGMLRSVLTKRYWRLLSFADVISRLDERVGAETNRLVTDAAFDPETGRWRVDAGGEPILADHVVIACPPHDPSISATFEPARRDAIANGVTHGAYMSAALRVRNWFPFDRYMQIGEVGQKDRICASRRDTPVVDGVATYVAFAPLSDADRIDPEEIIRTGVARDGAELQAIEEIAIHPVYNAHFTGEAIRAGLYHTVWNGQGRNNLWIVNSCLAQENWRDLSGLSHAVATRIARRTASPGGRAPGVEALHPTMQASG